MNNLRSTSSSRPFPTRSKREEAIDKTLESIAISLNVLNEVKDFTPVAAVGKVVPVLRLIVEQIRSARMNSKLASELVERIQDFVRVLDETVKEIQTRIDEIDQSMNNDPRYHLEGGQFNNPEQFNAIVRDLQKKLKPMSEEIERIQKKRLLSRVWHSNDVKLQLEKIKDEIANTLELFRTKQTIIVSATLQHVQAMVSDIRQKIANISYEIDLRALPHVDAGYDVIGDSGYVEGTRIGIISEIHECFENPNAARLLLLFGAAGTGKSTIAREICQQLRRKGSLGASYFFVRSDAGDLASMQSVFPTIAYQLSSLQPQFGQYIAHAAHTFTKLPSGSLKDQVESLIINPMKESQNVNSSSSSKPIIIVLDALDEAVGDLDSFLGSLKELVDREPRLRLFITTRPEAPIVRSLDAAGITALRKEMSEIPQDEVDSDIRLFLEHSFAKFWYRDKLLAEHPEAIVQLTKKAERLFIYARTVVQYLKCKAWEVSVQRLTVILSVGVSGIMGLYVLYATVLKNAYDDGAMENDILRKRVVGVLAGLVVLQDQVTIKLLAPLMGLEENEAVRTVEELRSVITCTGQDLRRDIIRPLHLTLREYLVDEERCVREFYVDRRAHHLQVAKSCLRIMNDELRQDICQLGDAFKEETKDLESRIQEHIPVHVQYACLYWSAHLVENEPTADPEVQSQLRRLCVKKLLPWIEVLSLMNRLDLAIHALLRVHLWAKEQTEAATLLEDTYRIVARFYEPINESPRQIYTSGLSFAPNCSLVNVYATEERSRIMVSPRDEVWGTCLNIVDCQREEMAVYSRDGQLIVSWWRKDIVIRDAMTGNPRKALRTEKEVFSVDIHPNSRSAVFLLVNGTVKEWDWTSESLPSRMYAMPEVGKYARDYRVTYSDDGSRIICLRGSVDTIFVWSTGNEMQPAKITPIPAGMTCKSFSLDADGEHMVALLTSKGELAIVQRWNIETGEKMSSLQIEVDKVYEAVFAKNNKMLATGHGRKICVWNLEDDCWTLSTTINGSFRTHDIAQSGNIIATGNIHGTCICFWDARSGEKLSEYQGHTNGINSLHFSPQEDRLVSTSRDESLRIWDTRREALPHSSDHTPRLYNVTFSPNGNHVAATTGTGVRVFDSSNNSLLTKFGGHTLSIRSLAFSSDGSLLATCSQADGVFLWDVERKAKRPWTLSRSKQLGYDAKLTFNADATLLAVLSWTNDTIRIWDIARRPHETDSEIDALVFQSGNLFVRHRSLHYIRFDPAEPLALLQNLLNNENEVFIWDRTRNGIESCAYDEEIHSASKPAFAQRDGWIVSTKTGKRLLWLPKDRTTDKHSEYNQFAVKGETIAFASEFGRFTILDVSRLSNS